MSYSQGSDYFRSNTTGKTWSYIQWGKAAAASKAEAKAAMLADDARFIEAQDQRHSRELTPRERLHGVKQVDTRPIREQIKLTGQPTTDPEQNPYSARLVELQTKMRHTTRVTERNKLERRIAQLQEASDAWDVKRSEERVVEARLNSPIYQKELAHAESTLEKSMLDPSSDQASIAEAKLRLQTLMQTGDATEYRQAFNRAEEISIGILRNRQTELEAAALEASQETGLGTGTNRLLTQ